MIDCPLFLLAGGFGTRLSKVVSDVPKPLAPVCGKPFLNYLINSYQKQGISHFVFLIHHFADKMRDFIKNECNKGLLKGSKVEIVEEASPLGTGGSIKNAIRELNVDGAFLVANADTYLNNGIREVYTAGYPSIACVVVDDVARYGNVQFENGLVKSFVEKGNSKGQGFINSGLYNLHSSIFDNMHKEAFGIEQELFPLLVKNNYLKAVSIDSEFIDIGIPEDYQKFKDKHEK
jgi:D-glycero-alpha-D-manno-heptose 1-phosphate guanylyltransferase